MSAVTLTASLLTLIGAAFMFAAILHARKIKGSVRPELKPRWRTMIVLMFFFLIAYFALLVIRLDRLALPTPLITAPVLLGGALFVYIVVNLTRDTIRAIQSAEEKLTASEKYLRSIIETEPECVKLLAEDGTLLAINPSGLEMVEANTADMVVGKSVYPLVTPECRNSFQKFVEDVCRGNKGSCEFEVVGLRGTRSRLESHAVPFYDEKNKKSVVLAVTRNVTEHRKLEERLSQAAKMEAIGTLTGGIAHDFNNILTIIMGYGEIMQDGMDLSDPLRNYVEQILAASRKGSALIDSLLAFSRKHVVHAHAVKVADILQPAQPLLSKLMGDEIKLRIVPADENLTVIADITQIERVLTNLASNARDAMPDGGLLTITVRKVEIDDAFITAHGYGKSGRYAVLTVTDNGRGMDEETKKRLFEPFYTTKGTGKGTGLGLSIVYGIIKQHNGYIDVYSEPGKGSSINVYLPLAEDTATTEETASPSEASRGGTETVLLAEDDDAVRGLARSLLEKYGYKVIEAVDGEDAIEKFRENKERIQLLLLDLVMPRKDGKEAYDSIRKIRAGVKVLFTSGYPGEVPHGKIKLTDDMEIISKPVSPAELARKVREVLDKPDIKTS